MSKNDFFPLLPLRDIVVFPGMIAPLFVGRDKSIKALNEVMKSNKKIILVTQKNAEIDDPIFKDIYSYGCESKVLQLLKLPDGTVKVLVEGEKRIKILKHNETTSNFLTCEVDIIEDQNVSKDLEAAIAYASKLNVDTMIYTNGVLLDEKRFLSLADAGLTICKVSCMGWDRDSYKYWMSVDKFDEVRDNLLRCKDAATRIGAATYLQTNHLIHDVSTNS